MPGMDDMTGYYQQALGAYREQRKPNYYWLVLFLTVTFGFFAGAIYIASHILTWDDTSVNTALTAGGGMLILSIFMMLLATTFPSRGQQLFATFLFIMVDLVVGGYIVDYLYETGLTQGVLYFVLTVVVSLAFAWVFVYGFMRTKWTARQNNGNSWGMKEADVFDEGAPGGADEEW